MVYWKSMLDKKRQEKIRPVLELEKTITEILVAHGRAVEPFVKVFSYSDENVTKSSLGTLVGVFEVAEQSEDSAYIVNFLASVARKEYFGNPRRSAVESFEAALHKINLALAELVKHGNIAWLGKFHGALGILEKNNLHFSVTGEAEILLLRNDGFSDISDGLASAESSVHPIKTFVEVSSGRMLAQDKVIFTSPELFGLLSLPDLAKNALRMDADRFSQFLRTALINELDMAGTIIIDFQEGSPALEKQATKTEETTHNVFSQQAFAPQLKTQTGNASQSESKKHEDAPLEYVDSKTGHIYVQGDTPGKPSAHQGLERAKLSIQNMAHAAGSFLATQGKLLRKGKKQSLMLFDVLIEQGGIAAHKAMRSTRRQWQQRFPVIQHETASPQPSQKSESGREPAHTPATPESIRQVSSASDLSTARDDAGIPDFMKEKLAAFYQKNGIPEPQEPTVAPPAKNLQGIIYMVVQFMRRTCKNGCARLRFFSRTLAFGTQYHFRRLSFFLRSLSPRQQQVMLAFGIVFIIVLGTGVFFLIRQNDAQSPITPTPQPAAPAFPIDMEKNARPLEPPTTLAAREDSIVASVLLDDDMYIITAKDIINIREDKRYTLPAGSGAIRLAAPMDDLRLIFIYTDASELFAWSPISRTFVKNTLSLPARASVRDIGTYLTYLYVLDGTNNQIYRFPRAEGGFGSATLWLKDPVTFEEGAQLAVDETIYVAPNTSIVQAFFRGRFVRNLESPNTPLAITSLFTHPEFANTYVLDTENKRILVWNQDGAIIAQYFSEQLAEAQTITVNEKTNEAFITTQNSLLSFKINPGQ